VSTQLGSNCFESTRSPGRDRIARNGFSLVLRHWWIAFAASALFVVSGHLMIKAGLNALTPLPADTSPLVRTLHAVLQAQVLSGLFIYLMGTVCWMRVVSQKEISFLYPLTSVNYVLVTAASVIFFHEMISTSRAAGVVLIVLGMILMNRQPRRKTA
jgi:drug/metabolite transporter (DMT)-like permease